MSCIVKECNLVCVRDYEYCIIHYEQHMCLHMSCVELATTNSNYCSEHQCSACGDQTNNTYCWRHECVVDKCHKRVFISNLFCVDHECSRCFDEREKDSKYCINCTKFDVRDNVKCLVEGCLEMCGISKVLCKIHCCATNCSRMVSPGKNICEACSCIMCDSPRLENTHVCVKHKCRMANCKRVALFNNVCSCHCECGSMKYTLVDLCQRCEIEMVD